MIKAIPLNFRDGVNNRLPETSLQIRGKESKGYVRSSNNLDIGIQAKTRPGWRLLSSGACHSLYANRDFALAVKDGYLTLIESGFIETQLQSVTSNLLMSYAEMNGTVYWTNGLEKGTFNGSVGPWGTPTPPSIYAVPSSYGGLYAGDYAVTATYIRTDLVESGAPEPTTVTVAEGGGITIYIPVIPSGISGVKFYITSANGNDFRECATVSSGSTIEIGTVDRGKELDTLFYGDILPGQIVRRFKAHLLIAHGDRLLFTPPFNSHVTHSFRQEYLLPEMISMVQPVEDGVYVGTKKTLWFYSGQDMRTMNKIVLNERGAIPGTGLELPPHVFGGSTGRTASWFDGDGVLCIGRTGGAVSKITEKTVAIDRYPIGSTGFITRDGLEAIISFFRGAGEVNNKIKNDTPVASINTNGVSV